jgi:hypothetical protein
MRRFPLHALGACTFAVLLVGCQSALEPVPQVRQPPLPPPVQSLSFEIAGPFQINASGSFSWAAFAFGGSGAYQYRWEVTRLAAQQIPLTTTERELSLFVADSDGDIVLTLTVTSGNEIRVRRFEVRNCIGGCDSGP